MPNPFTLNRAHGPHPAKFLHLATGDGILAVDVQAAMEVIALADGATVEDAEHSGAETETGPLKDFHAARELYARLRDCEGWERCPHGYATVMSLSAAGPRRFGPFVVRAPWDSAQPDALDIAIEPGLAFGLATHATTWLPLQRLAETVKPGMRCADVGCGSGILAIAMARLGAGEVEALDRDRVAVAEATDNVRRNGVEGIVTDIHKGSSDTLHGMFDLVAANMGGAPQVIAIAPGVAEHLSPNGLFLASGIYGETDPAANAAAAGVAAALSAMGLTEERRDLDHLCVGMVFRRTAR